MELLHHCQRCMMRTQACSLCMYVILTPYVVFWEQVHVWEHPYPIQLFLLILHCQGLWELFLSVCYVAHSSDVSLQYMAAIKVSWPHASTNVIYSRAWLVDTCCRVHYKYRLVTSLAMMLLLFILTTVFIYIDTSTCKHSYLHLMAWPSMW